MDRNKVSFTLFNQEEKLSKLRQMILLEARIQLWLRGDSKKVIFSPKKLIKDGVELHVSDEDAIKRYLGNDVLFNADLHGLKIFGQGKLEKKENRILLGSVSKIYKCERRENYRFSTYLSHNAKIYFQVDKQELDEQKKVLDFRRQNSGEQTNIFRSFLRLVDCDDSTVLESDGDQNIVAYRIFDISASGVAFKISEYERKWFDGKEKLGKFSILFADTEYLIPFGKIIYVVDFVDPDKQGLKLFKVGVQFGNVPDGLYAKLTRQITKELHESDGNKEFENFLD